MNKWNIISNKYYIDYIQNNSKYFKKKLGQSITVEQNSNRELRQGNFSTWYYNNYKAIIFKQGEIGPLHFFIDYYLKKNILGFFMENDLDNIQYAIEWDEDEVKEIGIDVWLSNKLQEIDNTIEENEKIKNEKTDKVGNPEKLRTSPGSTTWSDIKEYYNSKKNN